MKDAPSRRGETAEMKVAKRRSDHVGSMARSGPQMAAG